MRVLTFSRVFPKTHSKSGQPTYFVEKIWKALWDGEQSSMNPLAGYWELYDEAFPMSEDVKENIHVHKPKLHTIRAGNRWEEGDWFNPRVWSGKPYASKQIQFAPPIQIKKVWDIEIEGYCIWINKETKNILKLGTFVFELAKNDGLSPSDFWRWFPYKKGKRFSGQIICWNEKLDYMKK